jgi:dipicolinate synthase subunit B
MLLNNLKIGLGITGSFCTFSKVPSLIENLIKEGASVLPIMSYNAYNFDTRFGDAKDFIENVEKLCGNKVISTIQDAEPIGPRSMIDIMVIFPCTGNTLAKITNGITDTPVLMATKSHLRNQKPVLIGISSNDILSQNAKNLGMLLNTKNMFFIPFKQDDPEKKPNSMVCDINLAIPSIVKAMEYKQIQPVLV